MQEAHSQKQAWRRLETSVAVGYPLQTKLYTYVAAGNMKKKKGGPVGESK